MHEALLPLPGKLSTSMTKSIQEGKLAHAADRLHNLKPAPVAGVGVSVPPAEGIRFCPWSLSAEESSYPIPEISVFLLGYLDDRSFWLRDLFSRENKLDRFDIDILSRNK